MKLAPFAVYNRKRPAQNREVSPDGTNPAAGGGRSRVVPEAQKARQVAPAATLKGAEFGRVTNDPTQATILSSHPTAWTEYAKTATPWVVQSNANRNSREPWLHAYGPISAPDMNPSTRSGYAIPSATGQRPPRVAGNSGRRA